MEKGTSGYVTHLKECHYKAYRSPEAATWLFPLLLQLDVQLQTYT